MTRIESTLLQLKSALVPPIFEVSVPLDPEPQQSPQQPPPQQMEEVKEKVPEVMKMSVGSEMLRMLKTTAVSQDGPKP